MGLYEIKKLYRKETVNRVNRCVKSGRKYLHAIHLAEINVRNIQRTQNKIQQEIKTSQ